MNTILQNLVRNAGIFAGLALVAVLPAKATPLLYLSPVTQNILVGGTATVDLKISDLAGTLLGGWSADIVFDTNILSIPSVVFGSELQAGSVQFSGDFGAYFHADETADSGANLTGQPGGGFTLATFSFTGLTAGTSLVGFDSFGFFNSLSDHLGASIAFDSGPDVTINVAAVSGVPDSGVTLPLALCIGMMFVSRWFRKNSQ